MSRWGSVLVGVLLAGFAVAANVNLTQELQPLQVRELNKRSDGFSAVVDLAEPRFRSVTTTDGHSAQIVELPGTEMVGDENSPLVPMTSRLFRMPPTSAAQLTVESVEYTTYTGIEYASFAGVDAFANFDGTADAWFPEQVAEISEPMIFRGFRVAQMRTWPVQVNPARDEVRVISNIVYDVSFSGTDTRNTIAAPPTTISPSYLPYYRDFLDWDENELDQFEVRRGAVQVVVRTSGTDVLSQLQPWINWKKQKGWKIELLTNSDVPSWSATGIRSALQSRWTASEPKFDWVVVIGDATGSYSTPPANAESYGEGDANYGMLDGDDWIPEVGVGRISVESASDLAKYVSKVLLYEKTPYTTNTDWFLKGTVAAGSNSSGLSTIQVGRYARQAMYEIGYSSVDTAWYNDGQGDVNSRVINSLNSGVSFYNYRGYLGSGLNPSTINSLNNSFKIPFVLDITCGTGNWHSNTGYNEAWMRAGTVSQPRGAIGAISTATSSTHTRFNNSLAGGSIQAMLVHRIPEIGAAIFGARHNIYKSFWGFNSGAVADFATWANLMGDPTVWMWTDVPQTLTVTAPDAIELGANGYQVGVYDANSNPVEGAWVTLYKSDTSDDVALHQVTDETGMVTLYPDFDGAGSATLTVTAQNGYPIQNTVSVGSADRVSLLGFQVGDGAGDGDAMADASETVNLTLEAKNFAPTAFSNVSATISSDDPYIEAISGTASFGDMASSATAVATSTISVTVADDAPSAWSAELSVTFSSDEGSFVSSIPLELGAPNYTVLYNSPTGSLEPGTTSDITFTLQNLGTDAGNGGSAVLESRSPYLTVVNGNSTFPAAGEGAVATTGSFSIGVHPMSFVGFPATVRLILTDAMGKLDTSYTRITLGTPDVTDPVGPDSYGYSAFDDTDVDYDLAPTYSWIEIVPNEPNQQYTGQQLPIVDNGEDQDRAMVIDAPFPIQYYGETFDEITVTTNGIIAMGNQADLANFRNWTIPSPLGPNHMIAPFWDDRMTGSGGIYTYYDEPGGRLIITWHETTDFYGGSICTFQLVLYDQTGGHVTVSGDAEILFQYKTVNPSQGASFDVDFYTAGIENGDQTDGLQLAYWNQMASAMAPIQAGRAVLFTTLMELITGTIEGDVSYLADGEPAVGVTVGTDDGVFTTSTDTSGHYVLDRLVVGTHNLVLSGSGVNRMVASNVLVAEDSTTYVDFSATQPMFQVDTDSIFVVLEDEAEQVVTMNITNDGDGPTYFDAAIDIWGPDGPPPAAEPSAGPDELDETWDILVEIPLDDGEERNRGVVMYQGEMWVSGSNNSDSEGPNKLYRYDTDGTLLETFDQPVENPSSYGFFSLVTDGSYLYGSDNGAMYQMEYVNGELNLIGSFPLPVNPARHIAYDPDSDHFWVGDIMTDLYEVDRDGNELASFNPGGTLEGISWYRADPDGKPLYYIISQGTGPSYSLRKVDPSFSNFSMIRNIESPLGGVRDIDLSYGWNATMWTLNVLLDGGFMDDDMVRVYEVAENLEWIALSTNSDSVAAGGGTTSIDLTLRRLDLPDDSYENWIRFDHNAVGGVHFIPVTLVIGEYDAVEAEDLIPEQFVFEGVWPNPFNPTATVAFRLPTKELVRAKLYNVLGREVAQLANRTMPAGRHLMVMDGSSLASGVYFLRLEAGEMRVSRKVVLLK